MPVNLMTVLRSRRILQVRGSGAWIAFMRLELAAVVPLPILIPVRAEAPRPRLVGARCEQGELLNLLAALVMDPQLRRVPS
jgi:hypothetical protein